MDKDDKPSWLKSKGYLHITAQLDVERRSKELMAKVKNENFVSKYAFFPLLHANINERKFKKIVGQKRERAHSYKDEKGQYKKNTKVRPLHYSTHLDALIFGYYAELLQTKYELEISKYQGLSECIIAYRKIPIIDSENKHKSTIHFANEIFREIQFRSKINNTSVLTFDIKSFFPSLNHQRLKNCWSELLGSEKLPSDHYNVFKASTQFSYILLDELKIKTSNKNRKGGFNEKELARIRNKFGIQALFESPKDFRNKLKTGEIKLYKYPFRNKNTKQPIGIPQGLPISATLANLYLFKFDLFILQEVVKKLGGYYRRYSDDIVIVCDAAYTKL